MKPGFALVVNEQLLKNEGKRCSLKMMHRQLKYIFLSITSACPPNGIAWVYDEGYYND